ncbi:hypothetical protein AB1K91_02565 [Terribacillus sp. 179-K 1B1 HS]|uniref:hypothetical protein n=1 Tax=Terribacillus sp. 179-K 1B1 HS TaxID=3142388 RepID=UPI0039A2AEBF
MEGNGRYTYETVTVSRSEIATGGKRKVKNVLSIITGFVLALIALLLTITIIGFVIAIPVWLGAFAAFAYPFIYEAKIECPNCGKKRFVRKKQETAICLRCRTPIKVEWID